MILFLLGAFAVQGNTWFQIHTAVMRCIHQSGGIAVDISNISQKWLTGKNHWLSILEEANSYASLWGTTLDGH